MKNLSQKSQSAVEFVTLASFMLLVVVGFLAVTSSNMISAREEGNKKIAEDIAGFAYREIETAKSVNNGYIRIFNMPETVNGVKYAINITDNRELAVNYLDYEFVRFLPANVSGNISKGPNAITKKNNMVYINYVPIELPLPLLELLMIGNGNNVISFNDQGSVVLSGTLNSNSNPSENAADEFVVKNSNGIAVAIINFNTGNMDIRGSLFQNQASLNPSSNSNFIVKDNNGKVIDFIDDSGNFFLKGSLTQNGNPG